MEPATTATVSTGGSGSGSSAGSAAAPRFQPVRARDYYVEDARRVAQFIRERAKAASGGSYASPEIAVVVGSRLRGFELLIEDAVRVAFEDVHAAFPSFPTCSVPPGKEGGFIFGSIDGVPVLVMLGRFHMYEGHSAQATAFPIRVMKELGVHTVILTNAARGLSPTLEIGDVMLIVDHYNTERGAEAHPLAGVNIHPHGPRFLRCDNLYDTRLRRLARRVAKQRGIALKQGGYVFVSGPSYDTPMEEAGLRRLCELRGGWGRALAALKRWVPGGGEAKLVRVLDRGLNRCGLYDTAVGMSTVPEVLVADHCGLRVVALSGIYFVCKEGTRRMTLDAAAHGRGPAIAHCRLADRGDKKAQFERRRREEEEARQAEIAPKMIALLRGVVQALGDTKDIDMELDVAGITRWQIPTKLCVSWTRFFTVGALTALVLTAGASALAAQVAERRQGRGGR